VRSIGCKLFNRRANSKASSENDVSSKAIHIFSYEVLLISEVYQDKVASIAS
jgi:hypothetical protein